MLCLWPVDCRQPQAAILTVMEKLHECPVHFRYEQRLKRAS